MIIANTFWVATASAQAMPRHDVFGRYQQLNWDERDGLPQNIYRAHPDGSALEHLTDDPAFNDQATLWPDGRMAAAGLRVHAQRPLRHLDT